MAQHANLGFNVGHLKPPPCVHFRLQFTNIIPRKSAQNTVFFLHFLPPAQIGISRKRGPTWGQLTPPSWGHLRPQVTSQSFENYSKHSVFLHFLASSINQHEANLGLKVSRFTPPTWGQFRPHLTTLSFENYSKHLVFLHCLASSINQLKPNMKPT